DCASDYRRHRRRVGPAAAREGRPGSGQQRRGRHGAAEAQPPLLRGVPPMTPPSSVSLPELKRILVVDDEQVVLAALRETLRMEGYEVFGVESPIEALRLLRAHTFSVILTDQQMPG